MQDLERKKYRLVEEKESLVLLEAYHKILALELGGIDNWDYYGNALYNYIDGTVRENYPQLEHKEEDIYISEYVDFSDLAQEDLEDYNIFKK